MRLSIGTISIVGKCSINSKTNILEFISQTRKQVSISSSERMNFGWSTSNKWENNVSLFRSSSVDLEGDSWQATQNAINLIEDETFSLWKWKMVRTFHLYFRFKFIRKLFSRLHFVLFFWRSKLRDVNQTRQFQFTRKIKLFWPDKSHKDKYNWMYQRQKFFVVFFFFLCSFVEFLCFSLITFGCFVWFLARFSSLPTLVFSCIIKHNV